MTQLMTPQQLVANSNRITAEEVVRVRNYLNDVLSSLVLAPGQTTVKNLPLAKARTADTDIIRRLMQEAGYAAISVVPRDSETDIVLEFTIPPQQE